MLKLLGPVDGLRIAELGAGIGRCALRCRGLRRSFGVYQHAFVSPFSCRFTGPLASVAKSVVALDFMENLIDQNRASNAHYGNIDFRHGLLSVAFLPTLQTR